MKKWEIWKCEINQSNIEILTLTLLDYIAYLNWRCSLPEFRTLSVFLLNRAYLDERTDPSVVVTLAPCSDALCSIFPDNDGDRHG